MRSTIGRLELVLVLVKKDDRENFSSSTRILAAPVPFETFRVFGKQPRAASFHVRKRSCVYRLRMVVWRERKSGRATCRVPMPRIVVVTIMVRPPVWSGGDIETCSVTRGGTVRF